MEYLNGGWKYLLIFDACRYDIFREVYLELELDYPLKEYDSQAKNTVSWYKKHWQKRNNLVLVSAHPYPFTGKTKYAYKNFSKAIKAWEGNEVNPTKTLELIPNRRCLVHFIPPHLPYIGEYGVNLLAGLGLKNPSVYRNVYTAVQEYAREGHWSEVRKAYKENILRVLTTVLDNLDIFSGGKVIITADHGELIGEGNFYAHDPAKDKFGLLNKVPWMEIG